MLARIDPLRRSVARLRARSWSAARSPLHDGWCCYVATVDTLIDVLDRLGALGYLDELGPADLGVRWVQSGEVTSIDEVVVDEIVRLEGDSDPDDELIVYAVTAMASGRKGTFTAKFGPDTSSAETYLIEALAGRQR